MAGEDLVAGGDSGRAMAAGDCGEQGRRRWWAVASGDGGGDRRWAMASGDGGDGGRWLAGTGAVAGSGGEVVRGRRLSSATGEGRY